MKPSEDDFYAWWGQHKDGYPATPLMERCFSGGYECAMRKIVRTIIFFCIGVFAVFVFASLAACQDRYRYPCQNPKNWEMEECKRPLCAATQSCPDQLTKPEEMKGEVR